jgi:hypothetical protein
MPDQNFFKVNRKKLHYHCLLLVELWNTKFWWHFSHKLTLFTTVRVQNEASLYVAVSHFIRWLIYPAKLLSSVVTFASSFHYRCKKSVGNNTLLAWKYYLRSTSFMALPSLTTGVSVKVIFKCIISALTNSVQNDNTFKLTQYYKNMLRLESWFTKQEI